MRARAVVVLDGTGVTHGPIPTLVIGGVQVSMQVDPTEGGSIIAIEVPAGVGQASMPGYQRLPARLLLSGRGPKQPAADAASCLGG